jgi:hypothetical protein
MNPVTQRRSFLASVTSLAALAVVGGSAEAHDAATAATRQQGEGKWDLSWLDQLKGKHRQVFDLGSRDLTVSGNPLRVPRNYMNAHKEVYGLPDSQINTLVGITYDAFPMNASDRIWLDYKLGERWKIKDPSTGQWAVRNIFLDNVGGSPSAGVRTLQSRGTIFWQCNNALGGVVTDLAEATGKKAETVRDELIAGFVPGVKLVPAHTMLLGLAQEHGFTYEKL